MYSVLLYLEEPAAGGATRFTDLGITVPPKKGRALLWSNVMADNVTLPELRAHHESLPVEGGVKVAANLWLHSFEYRTLRDRACAYTMLPQAGPRGGLAHAADPALTHTHTLARACRRPALAAAGGGLGAPSRLPDHPRPPLLRRRV